MKWLAKLKSQVPGIGWPAVPDSVAANLLALLAQLEDSQWWTAGQLAQRQFDQFGLLAQQAWQHSSFFRKRFEQAGIDVNVKWNSASFARIPLLTRAELMQQAEHISCPLPRAHGAVHRIQTSGSTGQVVTVGKTEVNQLLWLALAMREHLWHERDFSATLAVIRVTSPTLDDPIQAARIGWGHPATLLFDTGPSYAQPLSMDVAQQATWLARIDPKYLLTYPTNLAALLDLYERGEATLPRSLQQVRTIGETLHPGLRERCAALGGIGIVDMYSAQEVGLIALQCPVSGLYHVQSESLILEVLDDAGQPCQPGEVGRVVITDLHNFATPLIRYEIRDYAEVGPVCPCGRGLPTLSRIMGRRRNMVTFPDGRKHWPLVGAYHYRDIADIRQYQVVQHSLSDIEVRLVTPEKISATQEAKLAKLVHAAIGHPFPLRFSYFEEELPATAGGKFEEFVSLVD